jgi:hypothetical protein
MSVLNLMFALYAIVGAAVTAIWLTKVIRRGGKW